MGYTQFLKEQYEDRLDEKAVMYIDRTIKAAQNMQTLIRALLAFSRVDRKGGEFVEADCNAVLENVLNNLHAVIMESGATLTVDSLPTVLADAVQLTSVFQNLVENAIKFSGDEPAKIHVSSKDDGEARIFSVRDHGIGIDAKNADRIFQIFKRLHSQQEVPGTGVGLSICQKIVGRHGGRIWVDAPEQGRGSVFRFTISS